MWKFTQPSISLPQCGSTVMPLYEWYFKISSELWTSLYLFHQKTLKFIFICLLLKNCLHKKYIFGLLFCFPGSADEDSGVGGSPGCNNNSSRPVASNCHSCNVCHKKFSRADILRKHVKTHVNSSCSVCGQIFNDKVALAKHQSEVSLEHLKLSFQ